MSLPQPSPEIDRLRPEIVEAWTEALVSEDLAAMQKSFKSHGAWGPKIAWNPQPENLPHEPMRFLLEHWHRLRGARPMPLARDIDALALRPALGFISLLDIVDGGADFRYRLFGTIPSAVSGFDMTRRLLSQHRASAYMVEYFLATYRAVLRRAEPLCTEHRPPTTIMTNAWHRIALPLGDDSGSITRFLSANIPVGHDGKVIAIGL
jgi:PAS domain